MKKLSKVCLILCLLAMWPLSSLASNSSSQLLLQGLGVGVPYFHNYSPKEYGAHARNFDVECDSTGHIIFANFEGLLIYDNVRWETHHTPGISRVTKLYTAQDGTIWFGGFNVFGYLDHLSPQYLVSDADSLTHIDEVDNIFERGGTIYCHTLTDQIYRVTNGTLVPDNLIYEDTSAFEEWQGHHVIKCLHPTPTLIVRILEGIGLASYNAQDLLRGFISTESGLCSSSINDIAFDGISTVWGATENGVFRLSVGNPFTFFRTNEGLKGEICSILPTGGTVYVGTMSGIYVLEDNHFVNMSALERACWMLSKNDKDQYFAATSVGLFLFYDTTTDYTRLSTRNTLSVFQLSDGSFLTGELDGIHQVYPDGKDKLIANIPRVTSFTLEDHDIIAAQTLYGEVYHLHPGDLTFKKVDLHGLRRLFRYVDPEGLIWQPGDRGLGVRVTDAKGNEEPRLSAWLGALSSYSITTIAFDNNAVWFGTQDGIIRLNRDYVYKYQPRPTEVYIREFQQDGRNVSTAFAARKNDPIGVQLYSYRLDDDQSWSQWDPDQTISFFNLSYGSYALEVRVKDIFGNIYYSKPHPFYVSFPFYLRWYSIIFYLILLYVIGRFVNDYRMRKLKLEQIRLEKVVRERTQQVVEQKNEIEEKTLRLEDTLKELKETQGELLRQEREATVGKLTKGLIDRILNPLNYINNFSHLSIGLAKDLKADIDDEKEHMSEDNFEDAQDVLQMLDSNLSKIEQHGLSTTRILKAMEELLRDRSSQLTEIDLGQICDQAVEVFRKYKAEEFLKYGITLEWEKPSSPVMAKGMSSQLIQTITSMLSNAEYALMKRADTADAGYKPVIRVSLLTDHEHHLYIYDNGMGMEDGIKDKIFDPFFTTKPTAEAPGVGLYLSHDIIQNHNGSIQVSSKKDEYTEFVITLPKIS